MTNYIKTSFLFGVLGGLLSGVSFYVLSLFHEDPTNLNLVLGYLITPLTIYLAIKFFKDYNNAGHISFEGGMSVGSVSFLLLAILSTGVIWGVLEISSSLLPAIQTSKLEVLQKNKELIISQVGQASFEVTQTNLQSMTAWDVALNDGIWKILPGIFLTPLFSSFLRKSLNEEFVKWYQKWWGIFLMYALIFFVVVWYSNYSKELISFFSSRSSNGSSSTNNACLGTGDESFIRSKMEQMDRDVLELNKVGERKYYVRYISWSSGSAVDGDQILDYSNSPCND